MSCNQNQPISLFEEATAPTNETAIRVENLSKCYQIYDTPRDRLKQFIIPRITRRSKHIQKQYFREFWALKDVSFEIKKGETVGIVGRNGSGKSTLLQIICGTLTPSGGAVSVHGRVAAILELGAGFNTEFTGRENIFLNAAILGVSREEILEKMDEISSFSELGEFLEQPVKTYSSGMYVKLAFSIAIHVSPDILIVDEALAVGDARFQAKCMRRIKDIQDSGATILFVSHDVTTVRTICQRAIWLEKGRAVMQGDVFQTTGRFMEVMFHDDQSISTDSAPLTNIEPAPMPVSTPSSTVATVAAVATVPSDITGFDVRPVIHWGSHKGAIIAASVHNERGQKKDVFELGELLRISITAQIPEDIDAEFLSIAVAIKDLKGTDLIVSTTRDREPIPLSQKGKITIQFSFKNPLVSGKYLLVAALENRRYRDIHYYEYLEGAHYFVSLSDKRFFGIFQPDIHQTVICN